jgi:hypothetical protein
LDRAGGFGGIVGLGDQSAQYIESGYELEKRSEKGLTDSHLVVSLALMAVFRSVRIVAIKGGRTGPVEFHLTRRTGRRTGRALID